jgi:hypothetical protein
MDTITDFEIWLDGTEIESNEELYALYKAVKDCSSFGSFKVEPARGRDDRWIISVPYSSTGLLLTSQAREAFLHRLRSGYGSYHIDSEE